MYLTNSTTWRDLWLRMECTQGHNTNSWFPELCRNLWWRARKQTGHVGVGHILSTCYMYTCSYSCAISDRSVWLVMRIQWIAVAIFVCNMNFRSHTVGCRASEPVAISVYMYLSSLSCHFFKPCTDISCLTTCTCWNKVSIIVLTLSLK